MDFRIELFVADLDASIRFYEVALSASDSTAARMPTPACGEARPYSDSVP
jgi:hypothetical protein